MNQEEFLLKQAEQQSQVIERLLKENASLRDIIIAYLLPGKQLSNTETELIKLMVGNFRTNSFQPDRMNGNMETHLFHDDENDGNSRTSRFHPGIQNGNSGNPSFLSDMKDGNNGSKSGNLDVTSGIDQASLAGVMNRLTPMMKRAPQKTRQNTALLLFYWQANPATAPAALRKFTGLSPDGMAKRVMAMKKAGLIVRYNHPLRYALTEKALEMLNGTIR